MSFKKMFITVWMALNLVVPIAFGEAASNWQKAGDTMAGALYVDVNTAQTVRKDAQMFLAVSAEERYTDAEFLAELRKGAGLEQASSALYLYLFNTKGTEYCTAAEYLLDVEGKVCAELGSDLEMRPVQDNALLNVYMLSLKALQDKDRIKQMLRKKR